MMLVLPMISRNLRKTDLNLFVVFSAIYDEGNITRAAEALNVTQPALSMQIREMEDHLGVTLCERRGKGVLLTSEGSVLDLPFPLWTGTTIASL